METNPPAFMVKVPFTVEAVPKFTPVVVVILLNATVPETVCVPVPANATECVPESASVPELVKVVPLVLLLMVRVLAVPVRVTAAPTTTDDTSAAAF